MPPLHKNDIQSLMVTDGVSEMGYTGLIFVNLRLKFNGIYCCDLLLSQQLLPAILHISGEFIFQKKVPQYASCSKVV